jgi:hypothetical protein
MFECSESSAPFSAAVESEFSVVWRRVALKQVNCKATSRLRLAWLHKCGEGRELFL